MAAESYGPYLGGYGAYVIPEKSDYDFPNGPGSADIDFDNGWGIGALFGYDYGEFRFEADVGYRNFDPSDSSNLRFSGSAGILSVMANVLYEYENESAFTPYVGAGLGVGWLTAGDVTVQGVKQDDEGFEAGFAYQGIAGARVAVDEAVSLFLDYRYIGLANVTYGGSEVDITTHNINAGLIYAFSTYDPPPPPVPQPGPAEVPAAATARSFMVFFDWNSSAITPEATAIIQDAAQSSMTLGVSRIELTGHADRSGSPGYNQSLSLRRAEAVKAQLVSLGLDPSEIVTVGKGESAPLVPTPDGAREPQNRRVEIVLP